MGPWLRALTELERDGEPAVLVTVVSARGSTPREAGCKMVVTAGTQYDTIGGGNLEFTCAEIARAMLDSRAEGPLLRDFPLGPELGQCCGGHVTVLFEPLRPWILHVALFGAGHVGQALVALLKGLRVRVTWIDTRADLIARAPAARAPAAGASANIQMRHTNDPAREVAELPAGTLVLVMTHAHQMDFDVVAAALPRGDLAGVGLIGSDTKRVRFVRRLARLGLSPEAIGQLICPIGITGISGKLPAEIAISVAAQILRIRQRMVEKGTMPMEAQENQAQESRVRPVCQAAAKCGDCGGDCAGTSLPSVANA